ncbi:MAG: hypothetical protein WAU84_26370, partial [Thermoguttaceae bacterium]
HSCLPQERAAHLAGRNVCPTGHSVAHPAGRGKTGGKQEIARFASDDNCALALHFDSLGSILHSRIKI